MKSTRLMLRFSMLAAVAMTSACSPNHADSQAGSSTDPANSASTPTPAAAATAEVRH